MSKYAEMREHLAGIKVGEEREVPVSDRIKQGWYHSTAISMRIKIKTKKLSDHTALVTRIT